MRRALAIGVGLALVLGAGAPAASDAAKRGKCAMKGSKTIVRDSRARVFYVRRSQTYYGCLYRTGRKRELPTYDYDAVDGFVLRSPYLAFEGGTTGGSMSTGDLWRMNLRTGKRQVVDTTGESFAGGSSVEGVLLTRRGAMVWIRETWSYDERTVSVEKYDAAGEETLDPGPNVAVGSLALTPSGRRVYWMNAGEPRTAVLR